MALTQITSEGIKDSEVKTADILNANVTTAKLADGSVTGSKLATESVSTVKIGDGQVTAAKLAADAVTSTGIADNAVVTAAINADAVTGAKIADDAVGAEHIEVLDADLQFGDSVKAQFGTHDDLKIYHDNTHGYVSNRKNNLYLEAPNYVQIASTDTNGSNQEISAKFLRNGGVELYYDNSKKIQTASHGLDILDDVVFDNGTNAGKDINWNESSNTMRWQDDVKAAFGASDDLQIWHQTGNSYITSTGANLTLRAADHLYLQDIDGNTMADFNDGGAVELYHNNSKKLETTSLGARVVGDLQMGNTAGVRFHHSGTSSIFESQTAGDALVFKTTPSGGSTTARLLIQSGGDAQLETGDLILGANGAGVQFWPHAGSSNKLTDYEWGSWTVTDSSGASLSISTPHQAPRYVKIGHFVNMQADMVYPTTSHSSHPKIGLPITGGQNYGGGHVNWTNYGGGLVIHIGANDFWISPAADSDASFSNADLSGKRIIFNVSYQMSS